MQNLSLFQKAFIGFLGLTLVTEAFLLAPVFFGAITNVLLVGAAVTAVANVAIKAVKKQHEKEEYPKYEYQAPDGSKIIVDPQRQQVTRRLSKDFARAADFRKGNIADLVTKTYSGNAITRTIKSALDRTLNVKFNKYARVNSKTMQEAREFDPGAVEVFVMEKYLKHAQEQYQKDKLAKAEREREAEGMVGAAPAAQQSRKNKNAPGV